MIIFVPSTLCFFSRTTARYTYNFTGGNSFWTFCCDLKLPQASSQFSSAAQQLRHPGRSKVPRSFCYRCCQRRMQFQQEVQVADGGCSACDDVPAGWILTTNKTFLSRIDMESIHSKASLKGINYVYLIGGEFGVVKTIEKQHGLWVGAKKVLVGLVRKKC